MFIQLYINQLCMSNVDDYHSRKNEEWGFVLN